MGDTVLKGGISNTVYVWHSGGGCDACESLDGQEFEFIEDIPDRPHPNCNCHIEEKEADGDECNCWDIIDSILDEADEAESEAEAMLSEIEEMCEDVESLYAEYQELKAEVEQIKAELEEMEPCGPDCEILTGYAINLKDDSDLEGKIYEIIKDIEEARVTFEIFQSHKHEMDAAANSMDKYYHAKANCESAELGLIETLWSVVWSIGKEIKDYIRKVIVEHQNALVILKDCIEDLRADLYGLMKAKQPGCCSDKVKDVYDIYKK